MTVTVKPLEQPQRIGGPLALSAALNLALAAVAETAEPSLARAGRWRVVGGRDGIEVRAAVNCHLPAAAQRLTRVAAGPALLAARLAVAVTGFRPFTALLPDSRRPGLIAVLRSGAAGVPSQAERALFAELIRPAADRHCESADMDAHVVRPLLRRAANAEGAWMRTVSDPGRQERLLGVRPAVSRGAGVGNPELLLVIGSHGGLPAGDVQAGQAMQRVVLTAWSLGLCATVFAGPSELATLRRKDIAGSGVGLLPEVGLRVGPTSPGPGDDV